MASSPTVSSARPSCGHATSASRTTSNRPMVPGKLRSQVNVPFCGSIFSPKLPLKIAVVSVCFILAGSFSRNGHVLRPCGTWNGSKKLNLVDCSWIIHRFFPISPTMTSISTRIFRRNHLKHRNRNPTKPRSPQPPSRAPIHPAPSTPPQRISKAAS